MTLENFNLNRVEREVLLSYQKNNAFPHTILVEGGTLSTRLSFARFLANMIVCTSLSEKPCGVCKACIKCNAQSNPDIKEYGEEKVNATFKVELSREIRQDAFVIPNDGDKKVYILKEAQNMNDASENALLKILEEPPHFDFFIMTSESRNAMLDTILSRSTVISLKDSDREISRECLELATGIALSICESDELKTLEALSALQAKKDLFEETAECLKVIFLDTLKYKQTQKNNSSYYEAVDILCNKLSVNKIYSLINTTDDLQLRFKQNANYNLLVTAMCVELRKAAGK